MIATYFQANGNVVAIIDCNADIFYLNAFNLALFFCLVISLVWKLSKEVTLLEMPASNIRFYFSILSNLFFSLFILGFYFVPFLLIVRIMSGQLRGTSDEAVPEEMRKELRLSRSVDSNMFFACFSYWIEQSFTLTKSAV